jgi:hypothetical protein
MSDVTPAAPKARLSFVSLQPLHVKQVLVAVPRRLVKDDLDDATIAAMIAGPSGAALHGDRPVACAGLLDEKEGRARAWALVAGDMPFTAWPELVGEMRRLVEAALDPATGWAHRVWAETIYDWPEGHKLLLHLGMSLEGLNRGAFSGGRHGATYARVRGDVEPLPTRWRALVEVAERCLWEDSMGHAIPWAVEQARRAERGRPF